jgi:hypothetical protein
MPAERWTDMPADARQCLVDAAVVVARDVLIDHVAGDLKGLHMCDALSFAQAVACLHEDVQTLRDVPKNPKNTKVIEKALAIVADWKSTVEPNDAYLSADSLSAVVLELVEALRR